MSTHTWKTPIPFGPARRGLGLRVALFLLALSAFAWAASYAYSATHETKKSPDHVFSVLTAYGQVCNQGCKYFGPDVVKFVQLSERKTAESWYTWTHVKTGLKHTKYFNHVRVVSRSESGFKLVTRQLDASDKQTIAYLTEKTSLEHAPVFDTGETVFTVTSSGDKTSVTQAMKLSASGMITMFGGRIEAGMRDGAKATFANIEK